MSKPDSVIPLPDGDLQDGVSSSYPQLTDKSKKKKKVTFAENIKEFCESANDDCGEDIGSIEIEENASCLWSSIFSMLDCEVKDDSPRYASHEDFVYLSKTQRHDVAMLYGGESNI